MAQFAAIFKEQILYILKFSAQYQLDKLVSVSLIWAECNLWNSKSLRLISEGLILSGNKLDN